MTHPALNMPTQTRQPQPLLSVENLSIGFNNSENQLIEALKGISFQVNAGEILAIVGESGSGKSVTSLAIMGLLAGNARIQSGKIIFADALSANTNTDTSSAEGTTVARDLLRCSARELKAIQGNDIAMIFQEPMTSLNPVLTIGDQLTEPMIAHQGLSSREALTEAKRLLDKVHIAHPNRILRSYPRALSGGMRQRIMIAMALACQPKLLIADEPTTALDVTVQAKILQILTELQQEQQMGVIFITHDMGVVAEIADRVVVMNKGCVVETGDVERIFQTPQQDYTKSLIASVPKLGDMRDRAWPQKFVLLGQDEDNTPHQTVDYQSEPLLEVANLTTRFVVEKSLLGKARREVHAVESLSFKLWSGETLALVGESGCGKSTTGRSIIRLNSAQNGEFHLAGQALHTLSDSEFKGQRKAIQMVFQDPYASLNPRLKVGFAIAEPLLTHGLVHSLKAAEPLVADLLERVGLTAEHGRRYPHEFSGGQRQRIAIARALAIKPKIIIADEAVSALDVSIQAQVINLMMDLQAQYAIAWLFISHDMAVVERIANRVAVMYVGQIVEIGSRQQIFNHPQHPYTKRLLSSVPIADPTKRKPYQLADLEIPTVIKKVGESVTRATYRQVSDGHFVADQDFGIRAECVNPIQ